MKKICKNCPFQKGMGWCGMWGKTPAAAWKIMALERTDEDGVFSCHMKNPLGCVFMGKMVNNDCAGFKMMQENMKQPNTHPNIVNNFNETLPEYDLKYWAEKSDYKSKLNLI